MDKIQKELKKLSPKEKRWVGNILFQLEQGDFLGLNIKRLKGHRDIFRVRKGDLRIIFLKEKKDIFIMAIDRRNEKTSNFRL